MTRIAPLLLLVVAVAVAGCAGDDDDGTDAADASTTTSVEGTATTDDPTTTTTSGDAAEGATGEYVAVDIVDGGGPMTPVEGTEISVDLAPDGTMHASAGCNRISGDYDIVDGTLEIGDLIMTEMGCDPARTDQEGWLLGLLRSSPAIEANGDGIVLSTEGTEVTFEDRSVVHPDAELVGTTWVVSGFLDGDVAISPISPDQTARLVLGADGVATGHDGCDGFEDLGYEVDGDRISFDDLPASELEDCDKEYTDRFRDTLSSPVEWSIDESSLTLVNDDGQGVTFRAE